MPLMSALRRQTSEALGQRQNPEFKASLLYRVTSRIARATQRNPVLKTKQEQKEFSAGVGDMRPCLSNNRFELTCGKKYIVKGQAGLNRGFGPSWGSIIDKEMPPGLETQGSDSIPTVAQGRDAGLIQ